MVGQPKITSRTYISRSSLRPLASKVGRRLSKKKCVLSLISHLKQCVGSKKVKKAMFADYLETSQQNRGHRFSKFEMLDAKIDSSLRKIIQKSNFKKKIHRADQKANKMTGAFVEDRLRS